MAEIPALAPRWQDVQDSLSRTWSFGWTPSFEASVPTARPPLETLALLIEAIEQFGWQILYVSEGSLETKRHNSHGIWTEKIVCSFDAGALRVRSESIEQSPTDFGRNSKRVRLVLAAFEAIAAEKDPEALREAVEQLARERDGTAYVEPVELPPPPQFGEPRPGFLFASLTGLGISVGVLVGLCSFYFTYLFVLIEFAVGWLFGKGIKYAARRSEYQWNLPLAPISQGYVALALFACEVTLWILFSREGYSGGLLQFVSDRLEAGLTFDGHQFGAWARVVQWVIFLVVGYYFSLLFAATEVMRQSVERIPSEVLDFVVHYGRLGEDEAQLRARLMSKGWTSARAQDLALEALGSLVELREMERQ